jgi:hypothetical protein
LLNWLKLFCFLISKILRYLTGVSLSQFLAFVDAYHNDANKQTSGPGAGASPTGEKNLEIGHDFKKDVWKAFTAHPDVLIGEEW